MFKFIKIDRIGIWFFWKGDEVCYVYPWFIDRRKVSDRKFWSIGFCSYFKSLKELDQEWENYFRDSAM